MQEDGTANQATQDQRWNAVCATFVPPLEMWMNERFGWIYPHAQKKCATALTPVVAVSAGNQTVSVQYRWDNAGVQPGFRNSHELGVMHLFKPCLEFATV